MSEPFQYHHHYILNRSYYEECFDESATPITGWRPYIKATAFVVLGFIIIASPAIEDVLGYLFIGLAALEALSIKFRRSWWLWRQLISKAANHKVDLTIDEDAVHIQSDFVNQTIRWQQVDRMESTTKGYLLHIGKARHYISRQVLNEKAMDFIENKITNLGS